MWKAKENPTMAVTYSDRPLQRVDVLSSFRWSAIAAGVLAALATQILLSTIGGAIGVSATAVTENADAARGLGVGAGIWFVLSPLVSMFVGGMVASWLSRPVDRGVALLHGALVWCVSLVIGAFFIGALATTAVSGALGTASSAATRAVNDDDGKSLRAEVKETKAEAKARAKDPEVKAAADDAANVGTGVAWASVLAMVLSLGSALLGASVAHRAIYAPALETHRADVRRREEVSPIVYPSGPEIRTQSRLDDDRRDLH